MSEKSNLSPRNELWLSRLSAYKAFLDANGERPSEYHGDIDEQRLSTWFTNQKTQHRLGKLHPDRIAALNETVPGWNAVERPRPKWDDVLPKLAEFISLRQRFPSAESSDADERFLGQWLRTQRESRTAKRDRNHAERSAKLDAVFPAWRDGYFFADQEWEKNLDLLVDHFKTTGALPRHSSDERDLAAWRQAQITAFRLGSLKASRIALLNEKLPGWEVLFGQQIKSDFWYATPERRHLLLGKASYAEVDAAYAEVAEHERAALSAEIPDLSSIRWSGLFLELKDHLATTGSAYPSGKRSRLLNKFLIENQRQLAEGTLSEHRKRLLDEICPSWEVTQAPSVGTGIKANSDEWRARFDEYASFVSENGRTPSNKSKDHSEALLAAWMKRQKDRSDYKEYVAQRLASIKESSPDAFDRYAGKWNQAFKKFSDFVGEHQRFPSSRSSDPEEAFIGNWILYQRETLPKRNDAKSRERAAKLDTVLPEWRNYKFFTDKEWHNNLARLKEFKESHGRFPKRTVPDEKQLATWRDTQMHRRNIGTLSPERAELFATVNITEAKDYVWDQRLSEYVTFVRVNGRPPSESSKDSTEQALQRWMRRQRDKLKMGEIPEDRILLLENAIFDAFGNKRKKMTWEEVFSLFSEFVLSYDRLPSPHSSDEDESFLGRWIRRQCDPRTARRDRRYAERAAQLDVTYPEWRSKDFLIK